ncbi:hypothetical protein A3A66_04775 [Microgenomates group bacterium RIFCSPLOWO2_01_FULL_46_13]|nr:MAG: hypothetical protein A2783_00235 [Microgenomates group bacterium RIFCSPHIGHO2_01_FULL_45_11]OGV94280.1 MAG: hypothetical protein A3A66_04775 [Microgenomates group bacterium RIFCSPLOWO2_01_FULL_46_13]
MTAVKVLATSLILFILAATPVFADGAYGEQVEKPKEEEKVHEPVPAALGDNLYAIAGGAVALASILAYAAKKTRYTYLLEK